MKPNEPQTLIIDKTVTMGIHYKMHDQFCTSFAQIS